MEDACDTCRTKLTKKFEDCQDDFKDCSWWAVVGAVGGGLVGLLGANPWTVGAGAALGASLAELACVDALAGCLGEGMENFCTCWDKNDCGDHPQDLPFKCDKILDDAKAIAQPKVVKTP